MEFRDWIVILLYLYLANGIALSAFIINISGGKGGKGNPLPIIRKFSWYFFIPGFCFVVVIVTFVANFLEVLRDKIWEV